jgi:hypothetical protein
MGISRFSVFLTDSKLKQSAQRGRLADADDAASPDIQSTGEAR